MDLWIRRGCVTAIVLVVASGCVPEDPADVGVPDAPDAPLVAVLAETIDEVRPPQVTFRSSIEQPADNDAHRYNTQYWDYVAPDEAALVAAAGELRDAAVADGWTLVSDYTDATGAGIFHAELVKPSMILDLRYATSASFSLDPDDEDVLRLTAEITFDPDLEG